MLHKDHSIFKLSLVSDTQSIPFTRNFLNPPINHPLNYHFSKNIFHNSTE